jgi:hypothetical protein
LAIHFANNDAVFLHLAELLAEHLLCDAGNCALQLREAHHLASEQVEENDKFCPLNQLDA